jgi:hypothetical protein
VVQLPGAGQDTELSDERPLAPGGSSTVMAPPQVPEVSFTKSPCCSSELLVYVPAALQLPGAGHETDAIST